MKPKKRTNPKHQKIQTLRHHIDQVDNQIVELLAKRQQLVVKVAQVKKRLHLPITQPAREKQLLAAKRKLAKQHSLSPNFFASLFKLIMTESRKIQTKIHRGTNL